RRFTTMDPGSRPRARRSGRRAIPPLTVERGAGSGLPARERAVLRAFAEVLLPEGEGLPGAEGDAGVAVVEPVCMLLSSAPSGVRRAVRAAVRTFEWTTFPRRFSRLSAGRRAAHHRRLEGGRRGLRRELFLLLKTLTAFGYTRDPEVQRVAGVMARRV